ncbi:MAG: molybdopterin molybdotransferase MoeA [Chitinophagaceae bacterium]
MLSFQEAQQIIAAEAVLPGTELLPLEKAIGRVLAKDVYTDRDYPPFNRAAMDGFALRFEDLNSGTRSFTITETIFAGDIPKEAAGSGSCYRIMTGAAVPEGMDVVIRVEDTVEEEGRMTTTIGSFKPFMNIAMQGEDAKRETLVLRCPLLCSASVAAVLATVGKSTVEVYALPRIALITTGNEVVAPDQIPSPLQIRNSNAAFLKGLLKEKGLEPEIVLHLPDDPQVMEPVLRESLSGDIVITCGGVSAGDADYVPELWNKLGVRELFHKVAIKPGKPIWCGKTEEGTMVFSLPGNPFSCLVTFKLFVETYMDLCYGRAMNAFRETMFIGTRNKRSALDEFFPARFVDGGFDVELLPYRGSGDVLAAKDADVLAWQPASRNTIAGERIKVLPLR